MKFRFRKERAKKIIQPYEQNLKESLFPPLSTQAITEIKKMRTNMIKNAGLGKFIKQYFPEEPTEKTIKDLEVVINKLVTNFGKTRDIEKLEDIFHLIQLWGGNTGRTIYVQNGGFSKNIDMIAYENLVATAMTFERLNDLADAIQTFKSKSKQICIPFITKHTRYFSKENRKYPFIPIYDSVMSKAYMEKWSKKYKKFIEIKSPQTPESESGKQGLIFYWQEMIALSDESGVPLDKIERILFNEAR
jgi:Ni,Fe-hydrogenase I large subunit